MEPTIIRNTELMTPTGEETEDKTLLSVSEEGELVVKSDGETSAALITNFGFSFNGGRPCLATVFNIFAFMEPVQVLSETRLSAEQLTEAAQSFGTPLYVYHAGKIREQYEN